MFCPYLLTGIDALHRMPVASGEEEAGMDTGPRHLLFMPGKLCKGR